MTTTPRLKALLVTLGCRLNTADTALMTTRLNRAGYEIFSETDDADLVIVNSCAVTSEASRKSCHMVRKMRKLHPRAIIVAAGCAASLEPEKFKASGADITVNNPGKKNILELLSAHRDALDDWGEFPVFTEEAVGSFPFRSRAFIKIQEGCNNFCTYCIVPYLRGRERSRNFEEVITDCQAALDQGFPELVLTGVNTCAYHDNGRTLGDLIDRIAALPGDFRIRLSSTEPHPANRNLLEVMAQHPKVCRFLHISLQYGNDRILKAMNRHYDTREFAEFVDKARCLMPGIHIGTDVIAGFPGETEADFAQCCDFVRQMKFANMHVFTYSRRPGTPAADFPDQVAPEIAAHRSAVLREIGEQAKQEFAASQRGQTLPVIFERIENDVARGWSDNYLEVQQPASQVELGKILPIVY